MYQTGWDLALVLGVAFGAGMLYRCYRAESGDKAGKLLRAIEERVLVIVVIVGIVVFVGGMILGQCLEVLDWLP